MFKTILVCLVTTVVSRAQTVDEILDKMEVNEQPQSSRTEMTQITYKPGKDESTSKLISYSLDKGDKGMMEYVSPARIKGMKILMLNDGDDIWFYSARTARVRKIASHQKNQSVNNSDFTYDDMSASDWREDYTVKLAGEEKKDGVTCFKIEMTPKDDDASYSKLFFWVDKEKYTGVAGEYYDEDGKLWKKLVLKEVVKIGNYWTPKYIEMQNVQKESRTVMKMDKIEYDIKLDGKMFSERYLKK